jgi:hypothetical protein
MPCRTGSAIRRRNGACTWAVLSAVFALWASGCAAPESLPFDRSHPVIVTNDAATHDVFQLEFALALSSRGDIDLRGVVAEKVWRGPDFDDYENDNFRDLIAMAGRSGMVRLPPVFDGYLPGGTWTLTTPASGLVEETRPIDSEGARFIQREVLAAGREKPVIVIAGGQVTSIASAYLLAVREGRGAEFAERVVVIADFGRVEGARAALNGFNLYVDPWAAFVVMKRLRTVLTTYRMADLGLVKRHEMIASMPSTELTRFMHDKDLTNEWLPGNIVGDSQGLLLVWHPRRGGYFNQLKRMSVREEWAKIDDRPWFPSGRTDGPVIAADPHGSVWVAGKLNPERESELFREVFHDPAAFSGVVHQRSPFHGRAFGLEGRLEAEHFDHGQQGVAYHDEAFSEVRSGSASALRLMERPDIVCRPDGTCAVGYFGGGEWLEYSVAALESGEWIGWVHASSPGGGGRFSLSFREAASGRIVHDSGPIAAPATGGYDRFEAVSVPPFHLEAGSYILRFSNLTPAERHEVESLAHSSNVTVETRQHPLASGGMAHVVHARRRGDFIEYRLNAAPEARRLILGYQSAEDHGCVILRIDGETHRNRAGRPFLVDMRVWAPEWRTFEFGSIRLDHEGEIRLRFEAVDPDTVSPGRRMALDYLEWITEGPYQVDGFFFSRRQSTEARR